MIQGIVSAGTTSGAISTSTIPLIEPFTIISVYAGFKIVGYLKEKYQDAQARQRQADNDREELLHQQRLEQATYQHREKMQKMDNQILELDHQIESVRDQIAALKNKNQAARKDQPKPNNGDFMLPEEFDK
jgi:uncharacterized protein HemX